MLRARPKFYLKEPTAKGDTLILCTAYIRNKRLKVSTGLKVDPKRWNANAQRMKRGTEHETLVNDRLEAIASRLQVIALELRNAGADVTADAIALRFKTQDAPTPKGGPKTLLEAYDVYITEQRGKLQRGTLAVHGTAKNHVENFGKAYSLAIAFERVDALWFDKFVAYLVNVVGVNNVTAWKVLKTFRAFLRWAHERGLTSNEEYKRFTKRKLPSGQQSIKPYLTADELQSLVELDLSSNARLDRTRDLAILQAFTGLRIGDVMRFRPELVEGNRMMLVTGKNKRAVTIPLLPPAKAVLDKYNGTLPVISVQKHNDALRDLLKHAGIDQLIVTVDFRGKERIEKTIPKYEAISTHSLKRSFVTVMSQRGVSVEALCKITGNTPATLRAYLVGTSEDAIREVENAWLKRSEEIPIEEVDDLTPEAISDMARKALATS